MKLSKRVNYKRVTKKSKNGKKSNRVKNSKQSKHSRQSRHSKKRQNRKINKKTQKGGVSLSCQTQYMVDKILFRDEKGTHVYSIKTQTVNERGEGEGEPVAEPKFIVRCGAEEGKQIELSGTSQLAELITNVVLEKIDAVTSSETLEDEEEDEEEEDEEEDEEEEEEAENDGSLDNEQKQNFNKFFNKLKENGTFEKIIRELNKFTGLSTLSMIELEALKFLRKIKSGNEPKTNEPNTNEPNTNEQNTNKLITAAQNKSLELLKEELKQAFEALLSNERFYALSQNNNLNFTNKKKLFNRQRGGIILEVIIATAVIITVDLLLSRRNKNKHNKLNTIISVLYDKEISGKLSETEEKQYEKYKKKRQKIEENRNKKKFGYHFNI